MHPLSIAAGRGGGLRRGLTWSTKIGEPLSIHDSLERARDIFLGSSGPRRFSRDPDIRAPGGEHFFPSREVESAWQARKSRLGELRLRLMHSSGTCKTFPFTSGALNTQILHPTARRSFHPPPAPQRARPLSISPRIRGLKIEKAPRTSPICFYCSLPLRLSNSNRDATQLSVDSIPI